MSVLNNSLLLGADAGGATGYSISRSIRLNAPDGAHLSRTPASAGNRKTWTWAGWVKRSALGSAQEIFAGGAGGTDNTQFEIGFSSTDILFCWGAATEFLNTTQVFRDVSAWYHIVVALDTTQATAANRLKVYVNGVQVTTFATDNRASLTQNGDFGVNQAALHTIGQRASAASWYLNGYLADIYFIDGQALDPTSFGEFSATTGVWVPKAYTGSYGTNGFRLDFSNNASTTTIAEDAAGSNDWTANNISVTAGAGNDSLVDVPVNGTQTDSGLGGEVRGNYCTLNPIAKPGGQTATLSNGNLDFAGVIANAYTTAVGTVAVNSGKWYVEYTIGTLGSANGFGFINAASLASAGDSWGIGQTVDGWARVGSGVQNSAGLVVTGLTAIASNDVVMLALDVDAGKTWWGRNGTWENSGNPATGTNAMITFTPGGKSFVVGVQGFGPSVSVTGSINFGQRSWAYASPSGFKALCTTNLPAPLITKPSTVFDVALDTGANILTAAQGKLSTGTDLIWIKDRANANNQQLIDTVRGGTATLQSNTTSAETTYSAPTGSSVAWCWDAGSSTVTNTQGSISSQVRANASAGFSIVTYTGTGSSATVGHGLNVAPQLLIVRRRSSAGSTANWAVWHGSLTAGQNLFLNTTDSASAYSPSRFTNTLPTPTVFSIGGGDETNYSGGTFVCYAFAPVAGYTSAFSFTGNGSADGPFCYLGLRPRFLLIKRTDSTGNWVLIDTAREGYNVDNDPLWANLSDAEGTTDLVDITSNGFKVRSTDVSVNASNGTYVGYAFAETPFQYSRAR